MVVPFQVVPAFTDVGFYPHLPGNLLRACICGTYRAPRGFGCGGGVANPPPDARFTRCLHHPPPPHRHTPRVPTEPGTFMPPPSGGGVGVGYGATLPRALPLPGGGWAETVGTWNRRCQGRRCPFPPPPLYPPGCCLPLLRSLTRTPAWLRRYAPYSVLLLVCRLGHGLHSAAPGKTAPACAAACTRGAARATPAPALLRTHAPPPPFGGRLPNSPDLPTPTAPYTVA